MAGDYGILIWDDSDREERKRKTCFFILYRSSTLPQSHLIVSANVAQNEDTLILLVDILPEYNFQWNLATDCQLQIGSQQGAHCKTVWHHARFHHDVFIYLNLTLIVGIRTTTKPSFCILYRLSMMLIDDVGMESGHVKPSRAKWLLNATTGTHI